MIGLEKFLKVIDDVTTFIIGDKRSGDDIVTEHSITFLQSVIGSNVILEHVNGEKISFNTSSFGITGIYGTKQ